MTVTYKTGKREAQPSASDLLASKYLDVEAATADGKLYVPHRRFGLGLTFPPDEWGVLGNADAGDCVFAGGAHEEMTYAKVLLGQIVPFTDESVLSDYAAVTGYDPNDPDTDQGAYTKDALRYRQHVGLRDGSGERHKIGPYVRLDAHDWDQLLAAIWTFGTVGVGFDFPRSAMDQFIARQPWSYVPGSPNEGGHYVCALGSMDPTSEITVVSWGRRQIMTREFYERYNDEAWTYVPGVTRPDGTSLHHVDLPTLYDDLEAIVRMRGTRGGTV